MATLVLDKVPDDLLSQLEQLAARERLPVAEKTVRILQELASQSHLQEIHFLWRPFLADADDDMVLELAFAASRGYIITYNVKDFRGSEQLGVTALSPARLVSDSMVNAENGECR